MSEEDYSNIHLIRGVMTEEEQARYKTIVMGMLQRHNAEDLIPMLLED